MSSESTSSGGGPLSSGSLLNGDPSAEPALAPRCGAKSRKPGGDPCQAPAMANGRCRVHGGLSTGPRTPEGRARVRTPRNKYGGYSAETQAALRRTDQFIAESRAMLAQIKAGTFWPAPASPPPPPPPSPPRLRLVGGTDWERQQVQAAGKTPAT